MAGVTITAYAVFAACLAALAALGVRVGREVSDAEDYFLGARKVPWIVAGLALVAAEVSALTVIGVPATSFREDWAFLQFFVGAAIARALVAVFFAPVLFGDGDTIYGYLGRRFGPVTQAGAAGVFAVSRVLISAVRLLAMSVAASALLGWPLWPTLTLLTIVGLVALARGGAIAAAWTGAFQTLVILGVGILSVILLLRRIDGGATVAFALADEAGKWRILEWGVLPAALATGFFGSAAAFGTDHELAQKLMTVSGPRDGRRAMALSIAGSFAMLATSLLVGTLLFVFYKQNPGMALPERLDRVYPYFAATAVRPLMRGLVLCAIVMASIDAPLASVSSVVVADLWRPFSPRPDRELPRARAAAIACGLALAGLAALFASSSPSMSLAFKAGGVTSGPLLGVFALGLFSERRGDGAAASAMTSMIGLNAFLLALSERGTLPFGWSWLTALGAVGAFSLGWALTRPAR